MVLTPESSSHYTTLVCSIWSGTASPPNLEVPGSSPPGLQGLGGGGCPVECACSPCARVGSVSSGCDVLTLRCLLCLSVRRPSRWKTSSRTSRMDTCSWPSWRSSLAASWSVSFLKLEPHLLSISPDLSPEGHAETPPTLSSVSMAISNICPVLNDFSASWIQEVFSPYFQAQQHRQGPVLPGGTKRE